MIIQYCKCSACPKAETFLCLCKKSEKKQLTLENRDLPPNTRVFPYTVISPQY